ncbi:hypothetical protein EDB85DRAFT_1926975 [Lactarius pseudohatsudake]|nr:hypothetical protein EDB85DRAFT_1926975 [Lactarius pseudohatsudake]
MSVPPTTTKPKTSRKSVVRRKLYAKLEAHLRINGTGAGNAPSTPSVQLPLPNVPVATRTQVDSLNATSLVSAPEVDSVPAQTPMAGPTDGQPPAPHPIPAPTDAPIPNLHLEQAMANTEKKRKAEGRTAAATSKKQKTATTLAEPTGTITINGTNSNQVVKVSPPTSMCTSRGYLTQTKRCVLAHKHVDAGPTAHCPIPRDSKQRCVSPKPPQGKRRRPPRSPAKRHRSTDRVCAGHASRSPIPPPLPSCCLSRAPQPLDPSR